MLFDQEVASIAHEGFDKLVVERTISVNGTCQPGSGTSECPPRDDEQQVALQRRPNPRDQFMTTPRGRPE